MTRMNHFIKRRLDFLIHEAAHESGASQDVKMVMRVISNYATLGRDVSSQKAYRENRWVSAAARDLLLSCVDFREWAGGGGHQRQVINEHQLPLKEIWIRARSEGVTSEGLWGLFKKYPMVTITLEEDRVLTRSANGINDPDKRYESAKIIRVDLGKSAWQFHQMHLSN